MEDKSLYDKILIYTFGGKTPSEISLLVDTSESEVRSIMKGQDFRNRLKEMVSKDNSTTNKENVSNVELAKEEIINGVLAAAKTMVELSQYGTNDDRLRMNACVDILDRAGLKPKEVVETVSRQYTPQEIESMNKTLCEVEKVTMRLINKDSSYVLPKSMRVSGGAKKDPSSVTEKAPDVKNRIKDTPTE